MKKLLFFLIIFFSNVLIAQEKISNLFKQSLTSEFTKLDLQTQQFIGKLPSALVVGIDANKNSLLYNTKKNYTIEIPTANSGVLEIDLVLANILAPNFKVIDSKNKEVAVVLPTFYWGKVKGSKESFVSLTVKGTTIEGIITTDNQSYTIGKIKNNTTNLHIIYNTNDIPNNTPYDAEEPIMIERKENEFPAKNNNTTQNETNAVTGCRAVDIYFEADNKTYIDLGSSMSNTTTYVTNLFNNVAQLYANEGVNLALGTIKVWDTLDPYAAAGSTSAALSLFDNITFTGDLAHLLSTKPLGGGIAYLEGGPSVYGGMTQRAVFQSCSQTNAFGVSASLSTTIVNVPSYSWNIEVIAHEMGHNFGLPHTHSCTWPGGAIDNCGPTAGYSEGTCTLPVTPLGSGTIMSYCHLTTGINFNNGFGPMPGDKLRAEVAAASCLGGSVALVPIVPNVARCNAGTVTLTATGCTGTYNWYNVATGGTSLSTAASYTTPSISATTTYYVDCTIATNCTSLRAKPQAIVLNGTSLLPTSTGGGGTNTCNPAVITLSAAGCFGGIYNWYAASTGGASLGTGATFTTPSIAATTTYYVDCTVGTCTPSSRVATVATVSPNPAALAACIPTSPNGLSIYFGIMNVTFNGITTINKSSGTSNADGVSYTDNSCLYRTTVNAGGTYAFSMGGYFTNVHRIKVFIDYNNNGLFTDAGETVFTGSTTGSTGGNVFTGNITIPTTAVTSVPLRMRVLADITTTSTQCLISGSATYGGGQIEDYAITVNCAVPPTPTTTAANRCGTGSLNLTASGCTSTYSWYAASSGGASLGTGASFATPSISTTTTYYVACEAGTCVSTRASAIATINTVPVAPTVSSITINTGQTATLNATACTGTVNWFSASTGGSSIGTGASFTTPALTVTTTYYADCTVGTCVSTTRGSGVVTVNNCPSTLVLASPANDISTGTVIKQASATIAVSPANIQATNKITGTGTRVTYEARSILLSPGFSAANGTVFTTTIGGCN